MLVKTFRHKSIKYDCLGTYQCHLIDDDYLLIVDGSHLDIVIDSSSFIYVDNDIWDKITKAYNCGTNQNIALITQTKYAYIHHYRKDTYHITVNNISIAFFYTLIGFNTCRYINNFCSVVKDKKQILYIKDLMKAS